MDDPRKRWPELAFPAQEIPVRQDAGKWQLRCVVRKKWVALEPEEWVRQHVVHALVDSGWPLGRMVLEYPVRFGQVAGRIDIACIDRDGHVSLAAEIKAPQVRLDERVAEQVARYDLAVSAPKVMITNGLRTAVWERSAEGKLIQAKQWPLPSSA
jgi:predicted type IV restriction endonuclease